MLSFIGQDALYQFEKETFIPPAAAAAKARRALRVREKESPSNRGMLRVGLARANQLAKRTPLSYATVKRMARFRRHQGNNNASDPTTRGSQAWDGWGGEPGVRWAERIVARKEGKKKAKA